MDIVVEIGDFLFKLRCFNENGPNTGIIGCIPSILAVAGFPFLQCQIGQDLQGQ